MHTPIDRARRYISIGMSALMLTLSVAIPLIERADLVTDPVLESEHNPSTCPRAHDHTVCTQVGANLALATRRVECSITTAVATIAARVEAPDGRTVVSIEGNPSRAPPSA